VSPYVTATTLIGGGVVKFGVGRPSKVKSLSFHFTNSGEKAVSNISPCNPRLGGEKSTEKLSKFKILETPTTGRKGEIEAVNGVFKEG
jgi:hypothetical protein